MKTEIHDAAGLFKISQSTPLLQNPLWADLRIESSKQLKVTLARGPGVYAIYYLNELIYVGKFLGTRENVYGGDVCATRWAKHMSTLTLRDRRVSFSSKAVRSMQLSSFLAPPFLEIIDASQQQVILDPRGRVSSLNRAIFASENWTTFSKLVMADELAGFKIIYTQAEVMPSLSHAHLRCAVGLAEKKLIGQYRPRCNAEIKAGTAGQISIEDIARTLEAVLAESLDTCKNLQILDLSLKALEGTNSPRSTELQHHLHGGNHDVVPSILSDIDIPDDECDCEEQFFEKIAGNQSALSAVESVCNSFSDVTDAYVQFTCTNGGDLRIRSTAGSRVFFNVATLAWQPKIGQFKSEIFLPFQDCLDLGASTAVQNYQGTTLPTRATFSIPAASQAIADSFVAATSRYRAG